jgi:cell division protein FtsI (penicillin-binding protein 3)
MNALTFDAGFAPSRIRLVDIRHRQLLTAQLRMLLLAAGFAFIALLALARIAWLGVVQPMSGRDRCLRMPSWFAVRRRLGGRFRW